MFHDFFRSTTEIAEGTSTDDEPVSKKIRTVEVCYELQNDLLT